MPTPDAGARMGHGFVYDRARERGLVFGGRAPNDSGSSLQDTWLVDEVDWTAASATYAPRGYVTGTFDELRERVIVYGGADLAPQATYYADTWEFDGSAWNARVDAAQPGRRSSNGLVYDQRRRVTVLFGGYDGRWKGDLWEWNGSDWTERCTSWTCATSPKPARRANPVFVYDEQREVAILFGGYGDGRSYDDTWAWDGTRWTELTPAESPPARDFAAATYDPISKRVLLFGGVTRELQELDDLWSWDGAAWSLIASSNPPGARQGARLIWHALRGRFLLLGGRFGDSATDAGNSRWSATRASPRATAMGAGA